MNLEGGLLHTFFPLYVRLTLPLLLFFFLRSRNVTAEPCNCTHLNPVGVRGSRRGELDRRGRRATEGPPPLRTSAMTHTRDSAAFGRSLQVRARAWRGQGNNGP